MAKKIKRGDIVELTIDDLAYGGAGVGRVDGFVCFVKHSAPGDVVRARVFKRKKNHAEAEIVEIVTPSPDRIEAPCPLFGTCGGCSWQHLPYSKQLEAKQSIIAQSLRHIGGIDDVEVPPVLPSPSEHRYRNKMDLTFGHTVKGEKALGFHRPQDFKRIINVESCLIAPKELDRLSDVARRFFEDNDLTCYNPVAHQGLLRHMLLRHSAATGDVVLVIASTTPPEGQSIDYAAFASAAKEACPGLRGFIWGTNDQLADVFQIERVLYSEGEDLLEEHLGDVKYRISSSAFFQVNSPAAKVLYDTIDDFLDMSGGESVLDAYCGTGSIGIYCARHAKEVWGLELIKEAVWNARENAALNGLTNCKFIAGDIRFTVELARDGMKGRPDRVIVDPPRGGMHKKALAGLLDLGAPVFAYVSCNPTTLARDIEAITAAGYRLTRLQPVDLFPQTFHVETVCRFER